MSQSASTLQGVPGWGCLSAKRRNEIRAALLARPWRGEQRHGRTPSRTRRTVFCCLLGALAFCGVHAPFPSSAVALNRSSCQDNGWSTQTATRFMRRREMHGLGSLCRNRVPVSHGMRFIRQGAAQPGSALIEHAICLRRLICHTQEPEATELRPSRERCRQYAWTILRAEQLTTGMWLKSWVGAAHVDWWGFL
jgi:hypothetical protein